jgi:hypothetical protein
MEVVVIRPLSEEHKDGFLEAIEVAAPAAG